jgi:hypothetical protein
MRSSNNAAVQKTGNAAERNRRDEQDRLHDREAVLAEDDG